MKIQWKKLILCIVIPLAVGGLSALSTRGGMEIFQSLNKPALAPPSWLFPVAWTILYILMGVASYLVLVSEKPYHKALDIYGVQLAFNYLWPIFFLLSRRIYFLLSGFVLLWLLILGLPLCFIGFLNQQGILCCRIYYG